MTARTQMVVVMKDGPYKVQGQVPWRTRPS
jgi:hypothetical protein